MTNELPPPPTYRPTTPTRHRALLFGSCVTIFLLLAVWLGLTISAAVGGLKLPSGDPDTQFEEIVVRGTGDQKIALIRIQGVIYADATGQDGVSARRIKHMLERAQSDDSVKAVILEIDSPGGGVAPSRQIYEKIVKLKAVKPVVALYGGDVAASGGVYVSMGASTIIADAETLTGSIGVIAESIDLSGLLEQYGIRFNTIKSGQYKDMGSFSRPMTDNERLLLQELIDESYTRFVEVVATARGKSVAEVKQFADGRVFSATKALEYGLIDKIGTMDDAEAAAKQLAGLTEATIIEYEPPFDLGSIFGLATAKLKPLDGLALVNRYRETNLHLMYLMQ